MAQHLTEHEKLEIIRKRFYERKTLDRIAREMKCGKTTVDRTLETFATTGHVERKEGSGRPTVMEPSMMEALDKLVRRKRNRTATELASDMEAKTGRRVSVRTIHRARRSLSYHPVHTDVRPSLTPEHAAKRLAFCRTHVTDSVLSWVFADETGFELDSHNRVYWIKRGEQRPIEFKIPSRCRINVWAAVSHYTRSTLWVSREYVSGPVYREILAAHLTPFMPWGRKTLIHDRVSFHRSAIVREWLEEKKVSVMDDFPPYSPDLNCIEHVWSWLKHTVSAAHPTTAALLTTAIETAWETLPQATIQGYVSNISTVMRQIIAADGWHSG